MLRSVLPAIFFVLPLAACSTPNDASDGLDLGPKPANAARSAACLEWQDAACDFLADKCSALSRTECDDDVGSMFCKPDDTMRACTTAYASASCPDSPDPCKGVADTAPARWYCNAFVEVLCTRAEACELQSKASCVADAPSTTLNCDLAVGARSSIDACLSQLTSLSCSALSGGQLPADCVGAIKVAQPYTSPRSPVQIPPWSSRVLPLVIHHVQ